jgi:hypothetical protein
MPPRVYCERHTVIQILMRGHAVKDILTILQSYSCFDYRIDECLAANFGTTSCSLQQRPRQTASVRVFAKCDPAYLPTLVEELQARFGDSIEICTEVSA